MDLRKGIQQAVSRALDSGEDVRVELSPAADIAAVRELSYEFGRPDFPGALHDLDWEAMLKLPGCLLAVWDFDYYQLSLRREGTLLLLRAHRPPGHEPAA